MSIKLATIKWQYEDELPEMTDDEFRLMFEASRVFYGVRMYPYVETDDGEILWLWD